MAVRVVLVTGCLGTDSARRYQHRRFVLRFDCGIFGSSLPLNARLQDLPFACELRQARLWMLD